MQVEYKPPEYGEKAFNCPYCNAYAAMEWQQLIDRDGRPTYVKIAECFRCAQRSVWRMFYGMKWKMVDPAVSTAPLPNEDLPEDCKETYLEAREIAQRSPRGAAALLRLCLQSLCKHLGQKGKNINDDIAEMVKEGLPVRIQQALDAIRVIGNNAVHPGKIPVHEDSDNVIALFSLINMIVDHQITQPNQVAAIFDALPTGAKAAVERRDFGEDT